MTHHPVNVSPSGLLLDYQWLATSAKFVPAFCPEQPLSGILATLTVN